MIPPKTHSQTGKGAEIDVSLTRQLARGEKLYTKKRYINHTTNYTPIRPSGMKVPCLLPYSLLLGYAQITAAECVLEDPAHHSHKVHARHYCGVPSRDGSHGIIPQLPFPAPPQSLAEQHCLGANQHQLKVGWETPHQSLPIASSLPLLQRMHPLTPGFFLQLSFLLSS